MKIRFDSDDDLRLNKQLKFPTMTIVVRFVFEEDGCDNRRFVIKYCCVHMYNIYSYLCFRCKKLIISNKY